MSYIIGHFLLQLLQQGISWCLLEVTLTHQKLS